MENTIRALDLAGVAVFAVAGSLAAGRKHMDLFGAVVLGLATALGGGTLRDVVLGASQVFWIADPAYVVIGATASMITFALARFLRPPVRLLAIADACGLAMFTVVGVQKAEAMGVAPVIAVIAGLMTGVAGGMIRDVLSGEIPLVLQREIYATASLAGGVAFVLLRHAWPGSPVNVVAAVIVTLALRLAAIRWNLALPVFQGPGEKGEK